MSEPTIEKMLDWLSAIKEGAELVVTYNWSRKDEKIYQSICSLIKYGPEVSRGWISDFANDIRTDGSPYEAILPEGNTKFFWSLEELIEYKLSEIPAKEHK